MAERASRSESRSQRRPKPEPDRISAPARGEAEGPLDLPSLLAPIVEQATRLLRAQDTGLYLYDAQRQELELIVTCSSPGRDLVGTRLKLGEGLAGRVARSRRPLIVEDYQSWEGRAPAYEGIPWRATMGVPLLWGDRLLGTLSVSAMDPRRTFSPQDLELLSVFAQQAALSVSYAQALLRERRWTQALQELQSLSAQWLRPQLDLQRLLEEIVQVGARMLGTRGGALYLYDERVNELELIVCHNLEADRRGLRLKPGEGLSGRVLETGRPLAIEDYPSWPGRSPRWADSGVTSVVGVPLISRGHVIGVLHATHLHEPKKFADEDVHLLQTFANQAAAAIERARWNELQRKFLSVGTQLLTAADLSRILQEVTDTLVNHSPFRVAAISIFSRPASLKDPEPPEIQEVHIAGLEPEQEHKLRQLAQERRLIPNRQIVARGRRIGRAYFVTPREIPELTDLGVPAPTSSESLRRPDWGDYDTLCYLMVLDDQVLGRVTLADPVHGRVPTPEELEPLEVLVNLATLAVQKARHLQQVHRYQERLRGIYRLSEHLAKLEGLEALIKQSVETIRENFAYDHVVLFLLEGEELVLRGYHTTLPREDEENLLLEDLRRFSIKRGICGWVARNKRPALVGDVRKDRRYIVGHPDIRSEMAVPIVEEDEVLGVLNIESVRQDAFTQEDLELLQALARQLGVAISNLRRRQRLQEALVEREHVNRFLQALNEAQELDELLRLIIRRGIDLLAPKADAGALILRDEATGEFAFRMVINRDLKPLQRVRYREDELLEVVRTATSPVILTRTLQYQNPTLQRVKEETGQEAPASTIVVPIREHDTHRLLAFLTINNLEEEGVFTEEDAQVLGTLVPEIELALARARDHERLKEMAIRDPLTGLYNRHYLNEIAKQELERAQRYGHPLAVVMVDVDHMHEINNRFGHLKGDFILKEAARLISENVRACDWAFRYGGDEFLILMPQTDGDAVLGRLRRAVAAWNRRRARRGHPRPDLNLSMGFSQWTPGDERTLEAILQEADERMYREKGKGR